MCPISGKLRKFGMLELSTTFTLTPWCEALFALSLSPAVSVRNLRVLSVNTGEVSSGTRFCVALVGPVSV